MSEVTIEMYRGVDPDDGVDTLFALLGNEGVRVVFGGDGDEWMSPDGFNVGDFFTYQLTLERIWTSKPSAIWNTSGRTLLLWRVKR
ncbi:hypothetical protein NMD75_04165 [Edwardsiella tarda]